ncbi:MAG: type VI secretion system baseplate subunit TssK [Deltaproteobacteria bacterium]|nr:type VI secretion system baseplate subunit TssK [Deltaproteobacteria bacterium]
MAKRFRPASRRSNWKWQPSERIYATAELNSTLADSRNMVYLAIKARMDSKELTAWVVEKGKAGSAKGVKSLTLLNVEGLRLEHLSGAPTEIAGGAGFEYFRVSTHGAQWNKVREEFAFGLSLGKLEDADARLFVVTPEG